MDFGLTTDPTICLPLLLAAFAVAVIIGLAMLQHNKYNHCLHVVSRKLGLKYVDTGFFYPPKLTGSIRDKDISVYTYNKYMDDQKKTYTRVETSHNSDIKDAVSITRGELISNIEKNMGVNELVHIDKDFDNIFIVIGKNSVEAREIITKDIQKILLESLLSITITKDNIIHEEKGFITDSAYLEKALNLLVDIAEKIEK